MNYNLAHFEKDSTEHFNAEILRLINDQESVLDFLRDYLVATNGLNQRTNAECFIQLAVKIRLNLEAVNVLLPMLLNDYRFKTSVNLLYRSIIDDTLNFFYLATFLLSNDPDQISLGNELSILHKEFILSAIKGIEAQQKHDRFMHEMLQLDPPTEEDFMVDLIAANPEIYVNGKVKKPAELRATSHVDFQKSLKDAEKPFMSEARKIKHLEHMGHGKVGVALEELFKYFSQYQHFSPKTHDFILSDIALDIAMYRKSFFQVLHLIDAGQKIIKVNDPDHFKSYYKEMVSAIAQ
jgi:hypothetical protein